MNGCWGIQIFKNPKCLWKCGNWIRIESLQTVATANKLAATGAAEMGENL